MHGSKIPGASTRLYTILSTGKAWRSFILEKKSAGHDVAMCAAALS